MRAFHNPTHLTKKEIDKQVAKVKYNLSYLAKKLTLSKSKTPNTNLSDYPLVTKYYSNRVISTAQKEFYQQKHLHYINLRVKFSFSFTSFKKEKGDNVVKIKVIEGYTTTTADPPYLLKLKSFLKRGVRISFFSDKFGIFLPKLHDFYKVETLKIKSNFAKFYLRSKCGYKELAYLQINGPYLLSSLQTTISKKITIRFNHPDYETFLLNYHIFNIKEVLWKLGSVNYNTLEGIGSCPKHNHELFEVLANESSLLEKHIEILDIASYFCSLRDTEIKKYTKGRLARYGDPLLPEGVSIITANNKKLSKKGIIRKKEVDEVLLKIRGIKMIIKFKVSSFITPPRVGFLWVIDLPHQVEMTSFKLSHCIKNA